MKYFSPFALALLLTSCAITPEDKQAAHQRQLEKEARENFIAMKAQEHPGRPPVLHDDAPVATPAPRLNPFASNRAAATPAARRSHAATVAAEPTPRFVPTPRQQAPRADTDTVYYWQVQNTRQRISPRWQAAEAKYARKLAKQPEALTPEERVWAHEHY